VPDSTFGAVGVAWCESSAGGWSGTAAEVVDGVSVASSVTNLFHSYLE
jgi:hypothetical protein